MIKEGIAQILEGLDLDAETMAAVMEEIMSGRATPAQIAAFLIGLRLKGETVTEIAAAARVMRRFATAIHPLDEKAAADGAVLVDTCGTGGDGAHTFNVSTAAAFVAAGGGLKVAKHGNRAVSSRCGSADLMERLGVRLDLAPADVENAIRSIGIGFLFAPLYHGAMAHAAPVRRDIGVRTIFNVLGPLTNPASAQVQVLGVFRPDLTETLAKVLCELGSREAFVVHGAGGLDELSLAGPTQVAHLKDGKVASFDIRPEEVGLAVAPLEAVRGGDAEKNARIVREIFEGRPGPARDIVALNAAAAFVVAHLVPNLSDGVRLAQEVIDSGRALKKMEALAAFGPAKESSAP